LESYKMLQDAQTASMLAAMLHEMTRLATTRGMTLADMAFFPTKTLSELSVDDMVTHLRHIGDRWAALMPHNKISALQDVERGKRLEVEETLGYAVRQSAALGIPTPTMDTCYKLTSFMSAITSFAPSRANVRAVARPIPEAPPVTNATLPSTRPAMVISPASTSCEVGHSPHIGYIRGELSTLCAPILYAVS